MEKSVFNFRTSTAVHLLDYTSPFFDIQPLVFSNRPLVLRRCIQLTKDLALVLNLWDALVVFYRMRLHYFINGALAPHRILLLIRAKSR